MNLNRMRILFVDTETNGVPRSRWIKEEDWMQWPEILQIAWEIWDIQEGQEPKCVKSEDYILKQSSDIKWDSVAESFHKIPLSLCQNSGNEWTPVLQMFMDDLLSCQNMVAHNLDFDRKIIRAGLWRCGIKTWPEKSIVESCTMRGTQGYFDFGLDKNGNPKAPKLTQLHDACIPGTYDCSGGGPWHDAKHDLHCCALCYWVLCKDQRAPEILTKCCQLTGSQFTNKDITLLKSIKPYTGK
jgi:hypothetical protein